MEQLWFIEDMDGELLIVPCQVVSETEKQYRFQRPDASNGKVNKEYVDKEPGTGGGKYYTSREKAINLWLAYHIRQQDYHQDLIARLRKA